MGIDHPDCCLSQQSVSIVSRIVIDGRDTNTFIALLELVRRTKNLEVQSRVKTSRRSIHKRKDILVRLWRSNWQRSAIAIRTESSRQRCAK
jgi:hypothetical protein